MADISAVCLATANPGQAGTKKRPPVSRTKKHDEVGNTGLPSKGVSLLPMINSEEATNLCRGRNGWRPSSLSELSTNHEQIGDFFRYFAVLHNKRIRRWPLATYSSAKLLTPTGC